MLDEQLANGQYGFMKDALLREQKLAEEREKMLSRAREIIGNLGLKVADLHGGVPLTTAPDAKGDASQISSLDWRAIRSLMRLLLDPVDRSVLGLATSLLNSAPVDMDVFEEALNTGVDGHVRKVSLQPGISLVNVGDNLGGVIELRMIQRSVDGENLDYILAELRNDIDWPGGDSPIQLTIQATKLGAGDKLRTMEQMTDVDKTPKVVLRLGSDLTEVSYLHPNETAKFTDVNSLNEDDLALLTFATQNGNMISHIIPTYISQDIFQGNRNERLQLLVDSGYFEATTEGYQLTQKGKLEAARRGIRATEFAPVSVVLDPTKEERNFSFDEVMDERGYSVEDIDAVVHEVEKLALEPEAVSALEMLAYHYKGAIQESQQLGEFAEKMKINEERAYDLLRVLENRGLIARYEGAINDFGLAYLKLHPKN